MLLYNNKPLTIIDQSSNKSRHVLRDFCSKNTVQKKVKWKKNRRWPGPGHFFLILPKHITEMSLIYLIISDWPPYFNREPIQSRLAKSGILLRNFFLSYCEGKYYQFVMEKGLGPIKIKKVNMVFCHQNCFDLLREKNYLVIEKNF